MVHFDLFNAAAHVIATRTKELRPVDIMRALRSFAKCSVPHEMLCTSLGNEVSNRFKAKGVNSGFKVEDLCEVAWIFCVLQAYHEEIFRLMLKQLEESPRISTDALCQLYECHLVLDSEHKEAYSKYRMEPDTLQALLDHYKENRRDVRRCSEKQRNNVASALKSLVEGTVNINHRTSIGLLVDVAALRKRTSADGYIHIDLDSPLTVVRSLEQDENMPPSFYIEGPVQLRRRILQKHGLRLVTVREGDWRELEEAKEKRRHLRTQLASLGNILE